METVYRLNTRELGSGFIIATRDLSIRGAGDILGAEQAGFIDSVGIDLYMKMLNDEILRLKGIEVEEELEEIDKTLLDISSHIKDTYVLEESIKIEIHKMIREIDSRKKLNEVRKELEDRFGKTDVDLNIYMEEQLFEKLTKNKGVEQITDNNKYIEIIFSKDKSDCINYQELFNKSISICKKFTFEYKRNKFHIKIPKQNIDKHPVFYLNQLLEEM